ncbi:MAG TPA: hypothetical protein VII87_09065 [Solirubrobacteraceae bacterium]
MRHSFAAWSVAPATGEQGAGRSPRGEGGLNFRGGPSSIDLGALAQTMATIFLARQPILNRDQSVEGYELLYRNGLAQEARVEDQALATARVAINALSEIGLERLLRGCRPQLPAAPIHQQRTSGAGPR